MPNLIVEMLFHLLVTALLGAVVGWLARGWLAARRGQEREETSRRQLRQSESRAGRLKNQLAEASLVEDRLRRELSRFKADSAAGLGAEKLEELRAELALRDKKIEMLELQVKQSRAALSSEWQSLNAVKAELAERQQRLEERGKTVSGKLRSSEETRQQLRLRLEAIERQGDRLRERLTATRQALADERRKAAARIAELETRLDERETIVELLKDTEAADEATPTEKAGSVDHSTPVDQAPAPAGWPADDLERIRGIGPVLRRKLHGIGVTSFRQIAAWTDDDVAEVARRIGGGPGRIRKGGWIEAARELAGEQP